MRVLQLNIWARYGPYETREWRLRRLFADLQPDLIAMEEVDAGRNGESQAHELLDGLGYEVAWEQRTPDQGGAPGLAVASRHPMLDRQLHQLGGDGWALAARIGLGEEAFWFSAAVTMSWTLGHEAERARRRWSSSTDG